MDSNPVPKSRKWRHRKAHLAVGLLLTAATLPLLAQDDVTTQHAASAVDGAFITGPASNPLSFLNGPAYRTYASQEPYEFPDFAPFTAFDKALPRWITFETEERFRREEYQGGNFRAGNDDSYLLNRFRFQLDLRAGSWFRTTAQVQDARPILQRPPVGPPNENRWDLKEAYAELGDPEKHWFSLRAGRQLINYNNTIIANSEWRNQGRSYDAAAVNLQRGPAHLGIFAASAVAPLASGISHHHQGNNIYGIYGRFQDILPHSSLEPFVLWRVQPAAVVEPSISKSTGKQDMKAWGLRLKGRAGVALDYSVEAIVETGSVGAEPIRAWATTEGVAYQVSNAHAWPRIFAQYDFASGNNDPARGVHRTFDTLYPTAHDRFGILDQFGWENIQAVRAGATLSPHRRWSVTAQGLDLRAASAVDAAYDSSGTAIGANKVASGRHIGAEVDAYTWYELNRHFNIGAGYGWFGGGSFLSHIVSSHAYSSSYIVLNFKDHGRAAAE